MNGSTQQPDAGPVASEFQRPKHARRTTRSETHAGTEPQSRHGAERRVIDAPVRMFHWLFATSLALAYLTSESERWRTVHANAGYLMIGLLAFRILYGLVGPRQARLGLLSSRLVAWKRWRDDFRKRRSLLEVDWRAALSIALAASVIALMVSFVPLALTGYAVYQDQADAGEASDWLEALHEFLGEWIVLVVGAHLAVLLALILFGRFGRVRAMITGKIAGRGPDLARHEHRWLAILLGLSSLAFFVGRLMFA